MDFIDFDTLRVRYDYLPSQKVPKGNILLLHTIGKSLNEFDVFLPYFQSEYNLLRYDLLGHGQSDIPSDKLTMEKLVNQLKFMTNHFFSDKFYIIANPASGYVASRFCRNNGYLVLGLILISPPPTYLSLIEKQNILDQMKQKAALSFDHFKNFMLSNLTVRQDNLSLSLLKNLFDQTTERAYFEFMDAYLSDDLNKDFNYIQTPILILAGAKDTLFPVSVYGVTANFMRAELEVIPNASTLCTFDNPAHSAETILHFLKESINQPKEKKGFQLDQKKMSDAIIQGFKPSQIKPVLTVELMDTFAVKYGGIQIEKGWNVRKAKSLFLYLIFYKTVKREKLINLFWPELELHKARNLLRVGLSHLKSILLLDKNADFIKTDREYVYLTCEIECDAIAYLNELENAYSQKISSELDLAFAINILKQSPEKLLTQLYDEWFLGIRELTEIQYCSLCSWVADNLRSLDKVDEASSYDLKAHQLLSL